MTAGAPATVLTIPTGPRKELRFSAHGHGEPTLSITAWKSNGRGGWKALGPGVTIKVAHLADFVAALSIAHARAVAQGLLGQSAAPTALEPDAARPAL